MAPKLQAGIDKFLGICSDEEGMEGELITEDDDDDVDVSIGCVFITLSGGCTVYTRVSCDFLRPNFHPKF